MFKDKNVSNDRSGLTTATLISSGTVLTGDLVSDHDLRIDGTIRGNVICKSKIIVGPSGFIEGNVDGQQADINGRITGNITVKDILQLRGNCVVEGNISSPKLQMDPTAVFNGKCQMSNTANIVQMSSNELQAAEAK
jgi:cytoskeletal protein CcmA (bactofilin family)